ncbi:MAG TPA: DUF308 domain-containing protein, partial [Aggregatilineales bacterium]|nr:DUF308 domain-containing protein [Aggregatilineales bacterium]
IFEVVAAVQLRKVVQGEWLLAVSGVLSVLFGILLIVFPGTGILALLTVLAAYAIIFGVLLIVLGFRMRGMTTGMGGTHAPTPA